MNAHGAAQELPSLSSFEDDDDLDFTEFAKRRRSPQRADTTTTQPPNVPADAEQAATAQKAETEAAPTSSRKRTRKTAGEKKATQPAAESPTKPTTERAPSYSERANAIKSSSVHIPTPLLEQLVAYRDQHKMSNGQVVIAAIEHAHPKLKDLIHPATTGGGLFAQRATKGTRLNEGPLTPLNVRLFKADYEVIDKLVNEFGAFSRGHLITVSLREFFSGN